MLTLLINAVGRDLLSLVASIFVMVTQDPVLALIGLVVAPPAMLVLRKLVKRIKGLAHNQFTGTADIMETMQESLQGIRTVKAFTLEADHAASASTTTSRSSSATPTRWRGSPTAPTR